MKKLLVILLLSLPAFSQGLGNLSLKHFQGVPTGNCSKNTLAENDLTGFLYSCDASQSPPQWSTNSFSGICTGAGNCTISGNLTVASGITYLHNPFNGDGTPIEGTTGVTVGLGAEPVLVGGNYQLKKCNTTNTTTPCWPVVAQRVGSVFTFSGSFTTGFAYIPSTGSSTTVTLDNTCTGPDGSGVGAHYLIRSPTVSGQYHDTGSSTAPTSGWYLGRCATSGTGAQSALIEPQVAGGAGGTSLAYWSTSPFPEVAGSSIMTAPSINKLALVAIYIDQTLAAINKMTVNISAADAGNSDGLCLYDSTGVQKMALAATTHASTGLQTLSPTSMALTPGWYYFGIAYNGTTATLRLGGTAVANFRTRLYADNSISVTSGACPASITPPADSWTNAGRAPFVVFDAE